MFHLAKQHFNQVTNQLNAINDKVVLAQTRTKHVELMAVQAENVRRSYHSNFRYQVGMNCGKVRNQSREC